MTDVITEQLDRESLDIAEDRIAKLREDFPEVFRDGKIDFDTLKRALGEHVEPENERFGLQWPGKAAAFQAVQTPSVATLLPDPDNSVDWDTTQNLIIEGDNLEVLKLLQKSYYGKVKMIYIDPPYNTGNDFIYPDNYREGLQSYLEFTGQVNAEGKKLTTNTESGGRYHSNWLNMMYPRLYLARNLLRDDGLIFVSISDVELAHLRMALEQVFGEHNFVECYIWNNTFRPDNSSKIFRRNAEYVLCFARDLSAITELVGETIVRTGLPSLTKSSMSPTVLRFPAKSVAFTLPDGVYQAGIRDSYELLDDVTVQDGTNLAAFRLRGRMIWAQANLEDELANGTVIRIKTTGFVPYVDKGEEGTLRPSKIISNERVGDVLAANSEMRALGMEGAFSYPKPTSLVRHFVGFQAENEIVLDFFAGSGSTAHAVMQKNAEDGGKRRSILVQLPEPLEPPKELADGTVFSTIADITRERVRRAGKKIAADNPNVDTGFRAYKLATSNFTPWDGAAPDAKQGKLDLNLPETAQKIARQLEAFTENVVPDRTQEDLLTEILLRLGYDLTVPVERLAISGHTVFAIDNGAILACLEPSLTLDLFEEMAQRDPGQIVCLDSAFGDDDELKVNAVQVIRSRARSEEATIKLWLV